MQNNPVEILNYIKPFFPDDSSLAVQAVTRLFPNVPDWIPQMIVFEMFNILNDIENFDKFVNSFDQYDDNISGKSRDLNIDIDLSNPISVN